MTIVFIESDITTYSDQMEGSRISVPVDIDLIHDVHISHLGSLSTHYVCAVRIHGFELAQLVCLVLFFTGKGVIVRPSPKTIGRSPFVLYMNRGIGTCDVCWHSMSLASRLLLTFTSLASCLLYAYI